MQDDPSRLEDDWVPPEDGRSLEEIEKETRQREAENRAVVLEMIGDLPEADAKPPSNMLFVCKLNPVTTEEVCSHHPVIADITAFVVDAWPQAQCSWRNIVKRMWHDRHSSCFLTSSFIHV